MNELEICRAAVNKYGIKAQMRMTQEELAELIVAISHVLRDRPHAWEELLEELADVYIMLIQLGHIYDTKGYTPSFDKMLETKLVRLEERINAPD